MKKVLAWVREHGPEYGADPSVVFVAGSSAGGHLASMAALTANDPSLQPGFEDADTSVTAVVSLYGYYGLGRAGAVLTDGVRRPGRAAVLRGAPRSGHAGRRRRRAAIRRARSAEARPNPVVYAELPGAQHAFDFFYSIRFEAVIDGIEAFADGVLRPT